MALDPQAQEVINLVIKSGRPAYNTLSPKDAAPAVPRDAPGFDADAAGDRRGAKPHRRRARRADPAARLPARRRGRPARRSRCSSTSTAAAG